MDSVNEYEFRNKFGEEIKLSLPYLIVVNYIQVPKSDLTKMVIFLIAMMTERDTFECE